MDDKYLLWILICNSFLQCKFNGWIAAIETYNTLNIKDFNA